MRRGVFEMLFISALAYTVIIASAMPARAQVIYPVIPFEGERIPAEEPKVGKWLDKAAKTVRAQIRASGRELREKPAEPELTYAGIFTSTAYCACPICTGEYSSGYTASGTWATQGRTVACNIFPFGTQLLIGGNVYTVEDTGYTPYGDAWVDIFFDSHDDALAYGCRQVEVWVIDD